MLSTTMKNTLFAALVIVGLGACTQSNSVEAQTSGASNQSNAAVSVDDKKADQNAREAIRKLNNKIEIDALGAAPIPGFREAVVAGNPIYISNDGRYMLQGSLYDMKTKADLSEARLSQVRKKLISAVPASEKIIFSPKNPKYVVSVFTDVECGYCQKMHSEMEEYNKQGIAIEYLAFPRMGLASEDYVKMQSVWCADDRKKAITDAKNGRLPPAKVCKSPVTMHYNLGQRLGLRGTPYIVAADGSEMPGYVPPAKLRELLDKLEKDGAKVGS